MLVTTARQHQPLQAALLACSVMCRQAVLQTSILAVGPNHATSLATP